MARIIEGERRIIQVSTDDIISIVKHYQHIIKGVHNYEQIRILLNNNKLYIPEDI